MKKKSEGFERRPLEFARVIGPRDLHSYCLGNQVTNGHTIT
jgi:hypothetical protein